MGSGRWVIGLILILIAIYLLFRQANSTAMYVGAVIVLIIGLMILFSKKKVSRPIIKKTPAVAKRTARRKPRRKKR